MRLSELMSNGVETIEVGAGVATARQKMKNRRIRHLVVMHKGSVVGVVSDRDLGRRNPGTHGAEVSLEDVMNWQVVTAEPDATTRQAANLMRGRGIGCLPVMSRGKLLGIVTTSDLLALIGRGGASLHDSGSGKADRRRKHLPKKPRPGPFHR